MKKTLLGMYHELKESASSSDFPYLLGNTMRKKLLARFGGFPSPWQQYVMKGDLADFKAHDRIILSEAPDLLKIEADAGYKDAKFSDARYQIQADTWGRSFTVDRRTIINDDLGGVMKMPEMFGRASVRTLVKAILTLLKGGYSTYDGKVLFHADHGNFLAGTALANTAAGMAAVAEACQKLALMTEPDSGELLGIKAKYLLTGTTLAPAARQLIHSAEILPSSTNGGGTYNEIKGLVHLEDPLIDTVLSTAWWAVLADPLDCPVVEVGFVNGVTEPELLVMQPEMSKLAGGGEDPYDFEFDALKYKVRWDFATQLAYYQGIVRGKN